MTYLYIARGPIRSLNSKIFIFVINKYKFVKQTNIFNIVERRGSAILINVITKLASDIRN